MTATYYSVVTLQGQAKVAAAIAGTGTITIAQLAAGDGNGAPVTPLVTQTALAREVFRGAVDSVARDPAYPTQVIVRATIPGSAGPATIRELGLYASDGQLVAVANYPATDIAAAGQGAVTDITVDFVLVVDTAAPVSITVNPATIVYLAAMRRAPFIGIDAFANAPPANPAADSLVVVGTAPTGAFAGLANQFAQWNGLVWLAAPAPLLTIVGNGSDGKYYQRLADGWHLMDLGAVTQLLQQTFLTTGSPAAPKLRALHATPAAADNIPSSVGTRISYGTTLKSNLVTSTWDGSRLTIGAGEAGEWDFSACANFSNGGGGAYTAIQITKNGTSIVGYGDRGQGNAGDGISPACSGSDVAAVGDYYEVYLYQQTGVTRATVANRRAQFKAILQTV